MPQTFKDKRFIVSFFIILFLIVGGFFFRDGIFKDSGIITANAAACSATGGTITQVGDYCIHTFTSSGTFVPTSDMDVEVFAWGGGGAGGTVGGWSYGSSGGAGGAAYGRVKVDSSSYAVVVGGGGAVNSTVGAVGGGGAASNDNVDNRYSGGGGGYSGLFVFSASQANAIIIAGGGGGGSSACSNYGAPLAAGGAGGGTSGQIGYAHPSYQNDRGNPGTQAAAGVDPNNAVITGGGGQGALQGGTTRYRSYGGGGGGGYWGGSGGGYNNVCDGMGGGGGGSGYLHSTLVSSGVLNTGSDTTPGNPYNDFRGTAGNAGSVAGAGNPGVVVIRYPLPMTLKQVGGYNIYTFTSNGTFTPPSGINKVDVLVVGGGGGGGMDMGGGAGGGGVIYSPNFAVAGAVPVTVGMGGRGAPAASTGGQPGTHQYTIPATNGGNSVFGSLTAVGGGFGGSSYYAYTPGAAGASGGSGGGASGYSDGNARSGGAGTSGQGYRGGNGGGQYYSGGGGGAGGQGTDSTAQPNGGPGIANSILGTNYYWGGGGGGASYTLATGGNGGIGGGGGGAVGTTTGGAGLNSGNPGGGGSPSCQTNMPGGDGGTNTGGGGGGGSHYNANNKGGNGGSGIVVVRYPVPVTLSYRKPITINNTSNASTLTDYQVLITVDTSSLISTGNMKSDCGDIRFTDNSASYNTGDWTNNYPYWIESGCNSLSTKIWVKVNSIAASSNKTIYMYYGNFSAQTLSNGDNTFNFFDDFDIFDTNKWQTVGTPAVNTVFGGILDFETNAGSQYIKSKAYTTTSGVALRSKQKDGTSATYPGEISFGIRNGGGVGKIAYTSDQYCLLVNNGTSESYTSGIADDDSWHIWDITWLTNESKFFKDGSQQGGTLTTNIPTMSLPITFGAIDAWGAVTTFTNMDWLFIRKYSSPEPTAAIATTASVQNLTIPSEVTNMTCSVASSCTTGTTLLKIYSGDGGHAGLSNSAVFSNKLCCSGVSGLGTNCSGNYDTFLILSDASDGHVEKKTGGSGYPSSACLSVTDGTVSCSYGSGSCSSGTSCIASISSDTNAHVGACGAFDTKVCCSVVKEADNSCWYCEHYYDANNNLQTGQNGQVGLSFDYIDSDPAATLSNYKIAIGTSASVASATVVTPWIASSASSGTTVTYTGTSVKMTPSAEMYQIGYGNGTTGATYHWWVKVKNSKSQESEWAEGATTFTTPKKHYPIVRVVANKTTTLAGADVQYCAGTDVSNPSDPCYAICWTGTGAPVIDPENTDWKCSICYNSSNQAVSCSTLNDGHTAFTWKVPSNYLLNTNYTLTSQDLISAQPIIKLKTVNSNLKMGLNITGSQCAGEGEVEVTAPLTTPKWREISPF